MSSFFVEERKFVPYPGVPANLTDKMERCVNDLLADPDFKPKKGRTRKESAIAICHVSIMGNRKKKVEGGEKNMKPVNINFYGDYWTDQAVDLAEEEEDEVEKAKLTTEQRKKIPGGKFAYIDSKGGKHLPIHDKAHAQNAMARWNQTQFESPEKKKSAARKILAAARRFGIEIDPKSGIAQAAKKAEEIETLGKEVKENMAEKEEEKKEEVKEEAEETEVEKQSYKDCIKKQMKAGKSMAEATKICKAGAKGKEEDKEKVEKEEKKPASPASLGKPAEVEQAAQVTDLLKSVIEKVEKIESRLKKAEEKPATTQGEPASPEGEPAAPAEGAASEEEAPKGGEKKTPVEEGKDTSTEGAEVQKSLGKVAGSLEKIESQMAKFVDQFKTLDGRLTKIEEQPVPSKVASPVVVSKRGSGLSSPDVQERLTEINKELAGLEKLKKTQMEKYQMEKGWDRAFELINEKEALLKNQA
ncbi:MAG: hypothetical protein KKB38_20105 [Gammaproteobacteria bacterium]|nr:hypothetical protein [Gammaproteobacteria bacterium]